MHILWKPYENLMELQRHIIFHIGFTLFPYFLHFGVQWSRALGLLMRQRATTAAGTSQDAQEAPSRHTRPFRGTQGYRWYLGASGGQISKNLTLSRTRCKFWFKFQFRKVLFCGTVDSVCTLIATSTDPQHGRGGGRTRGLFTSSVRSQLAKARLGRYRGGGIWK